MQAMYVEKIETGKVEKFKVLNSKKKERKNSQPKIFQKDLTRLALNFNTKPANYRE